MRKHTAAKPNFKVVLEGAKDAIAKYWESILSTIGKFAAVIQYDAGTGTVFITGEGNMLTLAGKLKDALRSIYFGLDVSMSKA